MKELMCAKCRRPITERQWFSLVLQKRAPYRQYVETVPLELYLHIKCVKGISVNISDLWDLIVVMNKLEGKQHG